MNGNLSGCWMDAFARQCPKASPGSGVLRSEFVISMLAGGKHTFKYCWQKSLIFD